ncbi:MAG: FecR family protein [Geobacteraceae bacterium]|nr:FecR family protein [Geobacteraceae bacterium]
MKILAGIITAVCLFAPLPCHAAGTPAGSVKTAHGTAVIIRDMTPVEAKSGTRVFQHDSLKTGPDGSMAIVFRDDTLLSIGPNSEVSINEFLFSPAQGKLSIVTRLIRGTAAYLSGIIGKLSPQSVRFETPVANIGIRGTKFAVQVENPAERP